MTQHPNIYHRSQPWSDEQHLHVATPYSNPLRWRTRRSLFNDFRQHMAQSPNVVLHVGELAYGDRPFEITGDDPNDVQLRTDTEVWHKENLANVIVQNFPKDWKYGAIIDGDFTMTRNDWAIEAIHALQHFSFVQLFSSLSDLSHKHRPCRMMSGFAYNYVNRRPDILKWTQAPADEWMNAAMCSGRGDWPKNPGAPGGAWAFTREAFDAVGRCLDVCILGSADWHMAFSLAGLDNHHSDLKYGTSEYLRYLRAWHLRAQRLHQNIGYIDNHAVHHFHGSKVNRFYGQRWEILVEEKYDPLMDTSFDRQGILQLGSEKPGLRDKIRAYFRSRDEDSHEMKGGERNLI